MRSFQAIHTGDGAVNCVLDYEGTRVVFGGNIAPKKWLINYGKDANLVIHKAFMVSNDFMERPMEKYILQKVS